MRSLMRARYRRGRKVPLNSLCPGDLFLFQPKLPNSDIREYCLVVLDDEGRAGIRGVNTRDRSIFYLKATAEVVPID